MTAASPAAEQPPRPLRRTAPQRSKLNPAGGPHSEDNEPMARILQQLRELQILQDIGADLVVS